MSTKSGTVHFQVHGSGVTRFARQFVLEGRWIDAQNMLLTGLPGLTYEMAVAICTGESRLHGVNEVELLPEEPDVRAEYQEELDWFLAGVYYDRPSNTYWRPYAVVTAWNRDDLRAGERFNNRWKVRPDAGLLFKPMASAIDKEFRSVYYMNDKQNDRAKALNYNVLGCGAVVLWEEITAILPAWSKRRHGTWQEALDDYVAVRGELEVRGGTETHDNPCDVFRKTPPSKPEPEEPEPTPEEILGPPPVQGDHTDELGWLLPDGRFFPCPYSDHRITARKIWYYLFDKQQPNDEEGAADNAGWVKCYRWEGLHAYAKNHMNSTQKEFIKLWAKHHNVAPMYDDEEGFTAY